MSILRLTTRQKGAIVPSMAQLLATNYRDLLNAIGNRYNRTIGHNTKARMGGEDSEVIVIELHGHPIVALWKDGTVDITLAGYGTVTTRERVNQFLPRNLRVVQRDYQQKLALTIDGQTHYLPLNSFEWRTVVTPDHGVEHAFVVAASN